MEVRDTWNSGGKNMLTLFTKWTRHWRETNRSTVAPFQGMLPKQGHPFGHWKKIVGLRIPTFGAATFWVSWTKRLARANFPVEKSPNDEIRSICFAVQPWHLRIGGCSVARVQQVSDW